jgi:hypothetical protein
MCARADLRSLERRRQAVERHADAYEGDAPTKAFIDAAWRRNP